MEKLKIWQRSSKSYYWIDQNLNNMTTCPHCQSPKIVKNGMTSYGKQNYRCHCCNRQAVERTRPPCFGRDELLARLLLERMSLRSIARILKVSLGWVVNHAKQYWRSVSRELPMGELTQPHLQLYCLEADEMWSFIGAKDCPEWLWLAVERRTGLIVGFHLGSRGKEGALGLWLSIPQKLRHKALVFTDDWDAYATVFAKGQHQVEGKKQTIKIERFNTTLRQRCARLVRKTLSFSKTWENHYLAIKYFLVHYNLERLAKKPSLC